MGFSFKAFLKQIPTQAHGNLYCEHSEHEGEAPAAFADGGGDASPFNSLPVFQNGDCSCSANTLRTLDRTCTFTLVR